jgi:alkylation response protein AidB-like acyl-CoA dehydrogenase
MQFGFDDDQLAMRDAVKALCLDHGGLTGVARREAEPADPAFWAGLAALGVLGMLTEDTPGIGIVEAALVFEELGAHLTSGPVLWSALAAPFVDGVATGTARVAGALLEDDVGAPVVVEHVVECDALVVLYADRIERLPRADLAVSAGSALDPLTPVGVLTSVGRGEVVARGAAVRDLRRAGEILSAALLVGTAQGALEVARAYALEREQFGVPIGSFQAIKHLLADAFVRVELARAATYAAAAIAAAPGAGDADHAAGAAKLLAGEAGIANGRVAVQVLGGMGFTWEMLPHYFLKRAWVLEHSFGTASAHGSRLGAALGDEMAVVTS